MRSTAANRRTSKLQLSRGISLSANEPNIHQIVLWRSQAEKDRKAALDAAIMLENEAEDGDVDAEVTAAELASQASASGEFIALYDEIIPRLQNMAQLEQQIGNTVTGKDGASKVGMPKEVVPLVRSQNIGNTHTSEGASSEVGIF